MRKLFILLLAVGLFTACKDKKATEPNTINREKDDYNTQVKDNNVDKKDDAGTETTTDPGNNTDNANNSNANYSSGWTSEQERSFITNCATEAVNGGLQSGQAQSYCSCMLGKFEKMYPNPADAATIKEEDLETPEMKKLAADCLKQ